MRIKINYILAILGAFFALDAFRIASALSIFSSDVGIVGLIVLIIGIVGLLGIYFYNKSNYNMASLIYLVAGILIILLLTIDSSLFSCIFYILAAIVAFVEGRREPSMTGNGFENNNNTGHYFNSNGEYPQYNNMNNPMNTPSRKNFDTKLLIIPVAIILVILVAVIAFNTTGDTQTLNVSNIQINSEGYSMYTVSCDMIPNRDYNYLGLVVVFYDSSNAEIGKSPLVWNINNPTKGQMIKVSGTAMTSNANMKPARAELYFFDKSFSTDPKDAIYAQNVTIN